jgi:hypothetical protein
MREKTAEFSRCGKFSIHPLTIDAPRRHRSFPRSPRAKSALSPEKTRKNGLFVLKTTQNLWKTGVFS